MSSGDDNQSQESGNWTDLNQEIYASNSNTDEDLNNNQLNSAQELIDLKRQLVYLQVIF